MRRSLLSICFSILLIACNDGDKSPALSKVGECSPKSVRTKTVEPFSAAREANEPWQEAFQRQEARFVSLRNESELPSASDVADYYHPNLDVSILPEWTYSDALLDTVFKLSRDERKYFDESHPAMKRRALWLYPYNGCFVRAAHVAQAFEKQKVTRPGKIFALGDLRLKTPYNRGGWVYWNYHVASAFRKGTDVFVLDAGVEPSRPLTLPEWLSKISDDPLKVKIALCDTFSYIPMSPCIGGPRSQERSTVNHMQYYLPDEWKRVREAGFTPEKVLGDEPPWREPIVPPPSKKPEPSESDGCV